MKSPIQLGPYRIGKKLGAGASASTYLATETVGQGQTTLLVCLKVPHPELARDPDFRRRFVGEAQIAARLHHPNIVQLEDVAEHRGVPFLVFDYVEGMDLAELLAATRADEALLDWQLVVFLAREVAQALEHAHEDHRGSGAPERQRPPVVHRDLAPPNILLGRSGGVYVTDFGLARTLDEPLRRSSGALRGRLAYAAPEYLRGQGCDARSDLYSFGVTFFEALVGRRPYPALHMHQRREHLARVLQGSRPTVHGLRPELDRATGAPPPGLVAFARILDELLEPDPAQRLPSAAVLVDRLGHIALPPSVERELRETVRQYLPPDRLAIRIRTGEHTAVTHDASDWSATAPRHLEHHLRFRPADGGFDPERDGLRVTADGVERLLAAYAHEKHESLDELLAIRPDAQPSFADTDPHRPAFDPESMLGSTAHASASIPTTNPHRSAFEPGPMLAATADAGPTPIIPATNPHRPAFEPGPMRTGGPWTETHIGPWQPSTAASPVRPAAPAATPPPSPGPAPSFAETHYGLPTAPPPLASSRRTRGALALAGCATVLAAASVCILSTANSVIVPWIYGEPWGGHTFDRTWTPILRYTGLGGLALAAIVGAVALALWAARSLGVPSRVR